MGREVIPIDGKATPNGIWIDFESGPRFLARSSLPEDVIENIPDK